MNILITGGAGFIGSNLVKFYLSNNQVTVIDSLLTGSLKNIQPFFAKKNFRFIKQDVLDYDFRLLDKFDIIYHLASPASPKKYKMYPLQTLMVNSYGTKKLLDFVKESQSKVFIFASTSEIYGDPLVHPQNEGYFGNVNPIGERACYDEGKRFGETITMTYFRNFCLDVRIARIFNTYGPNMEKDDGRVVSNFINQCLTNSPLTIYGTGQQTRSFCYITDLIRGLDSLAQNSEGKGKVINLGNIDEIKVLDLAKTIKSMIKSNSILNFLPISDDDPKQRQPDITKAKNILGWQPTIKLEEGLKKTIEYFKNL